MKYRSKKGTVINIPDGLTAKQIAAIKADADAGYGTRAQQTANKLGKKNSNPVATTPVVQGPGASISPGTVNKNDGTIDPGKASEDVRREEEKDIQKTWALQNPAKITDQWGNVTTLTRDPATGEIVQTSESGGTAKRFKDLAEAAASTFNGDVSRKRAEDATYGTLTKYYDRDMSRELEIQKQELANRGIPYDPAAAQDPNTTSLYGKTIGAIGEKYRGLKDSASQQAIIAGNQAYATDANARDSFLNTVTQGATAFGANVNPYASSQSTDSSQDTKDLISLSAQQYANKYGITVQEAIAKRNDATQRLGIAKQGAGGGGGGQSTGGFDI